MTKLARRRFALEGAASQITLGRQIRNLDRSVTKNSRSEMDGIHQSKGMRETRSDPTISATGRCWSLYVRLAFVRAADMSNIIAVDHLIDSKKSHHILEVTYGNMDLVSVAAGISQRSIAGT